VRLPAKLTLASVMALPSWIVWPGGLPCPWTRGTVDTVAAVRYQHVMADRDAAIARELNRLIEGT
jgi:hypothetical protein